MCLTRKKAGYNADTTKYLATAARVRDAVNAWMAVVDTVAHTHASNVVEGRLCMETRPRRERILGRFSLGLGSIQSHILMHATKPRCPLGICHVHSGKGRAWRSAYPGTYAGS